MSRNIILVEYIHKYYIWIVIFFGLLMRLVVINQSLWLDEAIGAEAVRNFSTSGIITTFLKYDNHPPLYYLTLKLWTDFFGYSEVSIRSLSILFGLGTIYLTFKIAEKLSGNKLFKYLAAILITTSQFHIYYSQEARMYSMAAFFACLTIYFFIDVVGKNLPKTKSWIFLSLSQAILVFTDYVPVFLLPVFGLYALVVRKNNVWWLKYLFTYIPIFIFSLVWLPTFMIQSAAGKWLLATLPAWRNVAGGATIKQALLVWVKFVLGRITFINKIFYVLITLFASIPVIISLIKASVVRKKILLIWLWFIVPLFLGYIISYLFPAFIYFRFLYIIPAFYLIIAWGIDHIKGEYTKWIIFLIILIVNLASWLYYASNINQQREQWRQATKYVEANAKVGEIAIFDYPQPITPYSWYENGSVPSFGVTDSVSADIVKTREITESRIVDIRGIYYFEYLRDLSDPNKAVEKTLKENGFKIAEIKNFVGVGQVFYYTK